jgi:hypothetical protein
MSTEDREAGLCVAPEGWTPRRPQSFIHGSKRSETTHNQPWMHRRNGRDEAERSCVRAALEHRHPVVSLDIFDITVQTIPLHT